jgi:hypothetical protein
MGLPAFGSIAQWGQVVAESPAETLLAGDHLGWVFRMVRRNQSSAC